VSVNNKSQYPEKVQKKNTHSTPRRLSFKSNAPTKRPKSERKKELNRKRIALEDLGFGV
jgi:hypothetical protein